MLAYKMGHSIFKGQVNVYLLARYYARVTRAASRGVATPHLQPQRHIVISDCMTSKGFSPSRGHLLELKAAKQEVQPVRHKMLKVVCVCRQHRGLRHYWGLRVKGQHTKTTGRRGRTVGVAKRKGG